MIHDDEKVYQVDYSQSPEEIKKQEDANKAAKLRYGARREQERFDKPTLIDKFMAGIDRVKALFSRNKTNQIQKIQNKNNQR